MEKILCKAKFKTNKVACITGIISVILLTLSLTVGYQQWTTIPYRTKTGFFNGFVWDMFIEVAPDRYIVWFFTFWIGIALLTYYVIIVLKMNRCSLTVSNTRVTGKASFGRQVDLPIKQISAVALGSFDRIAVATSAGQVSFWLVDNRNEVYETLYELLNTLQKDDDNKSTIVSTTDSADQIEKYKALLDKGIISQEEFDSKKKQLLGL